MKIDKVIENIEELLGLLENAKNKYELDAISASLNGIQVLLDAYRLKLEIQQSKA